MDVWSCIYCNDVLRQKAYQVIALWDYIQSQWTVNMHICMSWKYSAGVKKKKKKIARIARFPECCVGGPGRGLEPEPELLEELTTGVTTDSAMITSRLPSRGEHRGFFVFFFPNFVKVDLSSLSSQPACSSERMRCRPSLSGIYNVLYLESSSMLTAHCRANVLRELKRQETGRK